MTGLLWRPLPALAGPAPAGAGERVLLRDAVASGLAVIFGMLNIINFAHGALYMMGAFAGVDGAGVRSASTTGGAAAARR